MVAKQQDSSVLGTSFPRGGVEERRQKHTDEADNEDASKKNYKRKMKAQSMETEFLFGRKETGDGEVKKRSKKRKTSTSAEGVMNAQSMLPVGGGGVSLPSASGKQKKSASTAPTIEALGFSKLAKNTKILAVVKEVQEEFAIFSMPNLLNGYMLPIKKSGDLDEYSLPRCLRVGQTMAVAIQKVVKEQVSGGSVRKRIQVSALPQMVNTKDETAFGKPQIPVRGQIISIEDHGCLVDLGLGRRGFLSFDKIQGEYSLMDDEEEEEDSDSEMEGESEKPKKKHEKTVLSTGRLLDFFISADSNHGSNKTSVYSLKLPSQRNLAHHFVTPLASETSPYTLASIAPGWLVHVKVEAVAKNGLCVAFLNSVFRGSIELGHLGGYHMPPNSKDTNVIGNNANKEEVWKKIFRKYQHFPARVIAVDVPTKLIRLTLMPHLLQYQSAASLSASLPSIGSIVKDCTVVRTDPGIGALLTLPEEHALESPGLSRKMLKSSELFQAQEFQEAACLKAVYVHISKALDGDKTDQSASVFGKEFALGTNHPVRILGNGNWVDGVASGACAPSILESHVLTHSDLKPGQLYKQVPVIAQLKGGSILVQLGTNGIRALIPPMHLSESNNTSEYRKKILKTKYSVDAKIDVRVLWVDPIRKKCMATAKKSLVKAPESEIAASYESLTLGDKVTGFVSKVAEKSMYVTFFNKVYGVVTARSLATEMGMESIEGNYTIGDIVTCRIAKLKKRASRRKSSAFGQEADSDEEGGQRAYWEVTLSVKVETDEGMHGDEQEDFMELSNPKEVRIQAGNILPSKSMKIVELVKGKRKEKGSFVPGYAIVSIKSKYLLDSSDQDGMVTNLECKLPFDQLLDEYSAGDIDSVEDLDALAQRALKIGKKINQKGIILTDPHKSNVDYSSGIGKLPVVSIRKSFIQTVESQDSENESKAENVICPSPKTILFVGALLQGYVAQIDSRYGAFVRFLDGLTGLIPKKSGGLDMPLYETVVTKVKAIDEGKGQMQLQPINPPSTSKQKVHSTFPLKAGDHVDAKIVKVDFFAVTVRIVDDSVDEEKTQAILHCTMKASTLKKIKHHKKPVTNDLEKIAKWHPFYGLKAGQMLSQLTIVYTKRHRGKDQVYLSDQTKPAFASEQSELTPGTSASVVVTGVAPNNKGLYVDVSPLIKGFIPGLEVTKNIKILNNLSSQVFIGSKIECSVLDQTQWEENKAKNSNQNTKTATKSKPLLFSVLAEEANSEVTKPTRGDLIIGRIQRRLKQAQSPALMIALRGGFAGRCCITELEENDDWANMPIGRIQDEKKTVPEDDEDVNDKEPQEADDGNNDGNTESGSDSEFADGKYVECRVLKGVPKRPLVDVSLRSSRIEGDLDDDAAPEEGETVHAFVVETNKKGCFVRLGRGIEGRVTLKELCDGFLPDPSASFPAGRLVVGKVKTVRQAPKKSKHAINPVKFQVDLDMRESTVLDQKKLLTFDDIEKDSKYKGTITRVESYGVFVQIKDSKVSGLAHLSQCSDNYIKNLGALYDPGDLVKLLVIKKDAGNKTLGFSLKASHFEDDEDSDDSSMDSESDDEEMLDVEGLDSDDENFGAKLAAKMQQDENSDDDSSSEEDDSEDDDSDDDVDEKSSTPEDDSEDEDEAPKALLDTDVGFDWNAKGSAAKSKSGENDASDDSESDSDDDSDDEENEGKTSNHKSRKKQAERRREEKEISRREMALADGTADENPETAGDFERLLAGNPNSSELWIRYMAFYLSLADIPSARKVAENALDRIEFREETEKLNVWTALMTLEHKYGNYDSLHQTVERACGHCNPKHVYLRICEILVKDVVATSNPESVVRANAMFVKMCKKFKSKKKVWLAHLEYLLQNGRHQEAHSLMKRALLSLKPYKHAETMSKFAQLEFEFGATERARTVFDGIVKKFPKRLDLFFVYVDKEVKYGTVSHARNLLENKVAEGKLSDKQMKSLFKKWFRMEEAHGNAEEQDHVKETAREYVEKSM
ncbi:MAG: hypothetical protein SGBAC_006712 [Bacillariaceae sp.]